MSDNIHQRVDLNSTENRKIYGTIGPVERAGIAFDEQLYAKSLAEQQERLKNSKYEGAIGRAVPRYDVPCGGLTAAQMHDPVNSPSHYTDGGIETIDFIEAKKLNYNLGNVVKYITRADLKGNKIQDLEKAAWYLAREIKTPKGK